ncbi:hypothetical protein, partial [Nonomuraea sp. NPDC001023]|uniref:hypothetical protein n=1 Tax=Nonomuraea sp. NPDC001023 TaxID=3154770 RepID=UPI003318F10E
MNHQVTRNRKAAWSRLATRNREATQSRQAAWSRLATGSRQGARNRRARAIGRDRPGPGGAPSIAGLRSEISGRYGVRREVGGGLGTPQP